MSWITYGGSICCCQTNIVRFSVHIVCSSRSVIMAGGCATSRATAHSRLSSLHLIFISMDWFLGRLYWVDLINWVSNISLLHLMFISMDWTRLKFLSVVTALRASAKLLNVEMGDQSQYTVLVTKPVTEANSAWPSLAVVSATAREAANSVS